MANKVGKLIKEARTEAGMTQEQLARKVKDVSASDISKAERGELKLSQDALKQIAKATGVTQKSLLDAASSSSYRAASSGSTGSSSRSTTRSSGSSSSQTSMKVSSAEKKLVELYRQADSDTKKMVLSILKGDSADFPDNDDIGPEMPGNGMPGPGMPPGPDMPGQFMGDGRRPDFIPDGGKGKNDTGIGSIINGLKDLL